MQLDKQGKYEEAVKTGQKILEMTELAFGLEHARTRVVLFRLGSIFFDQAKFTEASPLIERALEISEKTLGKEDPEVAYILVFLAINCNGQGRFPEAEKLLSRALKIAEKAFGIDDPRLAYFIFMQGDLYQCWGKFAEAESLYKRALEIKQQEFGMEHPEVADMLAWIGHFNLVVGRYTEAEEMLEQALAVEEKTFGPHHPRVANVLRFLGQVHRTEGNYSEAESLFSRALEIREKALGPDHPRVANCLNELGVLYFAQGNYEAAEPLHKRALEIRKRVYGTRRSEVAQSMMYLAELYMYQGEYTEAGSLLEEGIAIVGKKETYLLVYYLDKMSKLEILKDCPVTALALLLRAISMDDEIIDNVFSTATERNMFAFLRTVSRRFDEFQSLVAMELPTNKEAVRSAMDAVLRRKGRVLEALSRERSAMLEAADPRVLETFRELQTVASRLSSSALGGRGDTDPTEYKRRLAELETRKDSLENELARLSAAFAAKQRSRKVNADSLALMLDPGSVLVEYLSYQTYDFRSTGSEWKEGKPHYHAFVLPGGEKTEPLLIDLGDGETIDRAVREFRREMAAAPRVIMREGEKKAELRLAEKSKRIYELAFAPLKKVLGKNKTLFLAPDGDLNLVPFGALQDEQGRYLIESYQFNYLSTGRDLMSFLPGESPESKVVLLADPDYDAGHKESEVTAPASVDS
ncbi:tetratricopeptide repeat protein, partial [Gemmatimonadota bacterium]